MPNCSRTLHHCSQDGKHETITLSVIIVNWNVRDHLERALQSLFAHYPWSNLEVYVVDNASSDGSIELVRCKFPQVRLIENKKNVGFSCGNNQAICLAQGRYIMLLNPDTVWLDGSLRRMITFMDSHPEVGALGPKLLNSDRQSIQYAGARRLPRPVDTFFEYVSLTSLFPRNRLFGRYLIGEWDHTDSRQVDCLSGACLLVRKEALEEVGLLDEGYALYQEDIDWCHRFGLKQWKLFYYAEAQLVHIGRQSTLQNRGPATVRAVRGVYRYYYKFHGLPAALSAWLLVWIASIAKLVAWAGILLVKRNSRELAIKQIKAFWKVLWLSPIEK